LPTLVWITLLGCGDGDTPTTRGPRSSTLAHAIAQDFATRHQAQASVACFLAFGAGVCAAELTDGTTIPIAVHDAGSAWEWHIEPMLVDAAPIEAHVRAMLADLGIAQDVACGARLRALADGERIACKLSGGGTAFATVAPGGKLSVELALDADTATARTMTRDDLTQMSNALQHADGDAGVE